KTIHTRDHSPYANHGTLVNMSPTTSWVAGAPLDFYNPNALDFDGTDDVVTAPYSDTLRITGDLTTAWWQKLDSTPGTGNAEVVVSFGGSGESEATNILYAHGILNDGGTVKYRAFHEHGAGANVE